jgi:hypothetical protein
MFCRNGGLLRGIQKKLPENRTEKTKKDGLFRFASPSSSQISETRSKNRQVDQSIFFGPQDICSAQASNERETKIYQTRPGKRDEREEGAEVGLAWQR